MIAPAIFRFSYRVGLPGLTSFALNTLLCTVTLLTRAAALQAWPHAPFIHYKLPVYAGAHEKTGMILSRKLARIDPIRGLNIALAILCIAVIPATAFGQLRLPALFCDDMVLQQERSAPVWGWASPGEQIRVEIAGQSKRTTADSTGHWKIVLDPLKAGGPVEMTISGKTTLTLHNILVGEVWLCSGQSNMQWPVSLSENGPQEILKTGFENIRLFTVQRSVADSPRTDVIGRWARSDVFSVSGFSAVAYFYGRELYRELHVPIGLIDASFGASTAEAWMSREALAADPAFATILQGYDEALAKSKGLERIIEDWRSYQEAQLVEWRWNAEKAKARGETPPKQPTEPTGPRPQRVPSTLSNGMIAPLIPFSIRGVIWYQGESNTPQASLYYKLFPALIRNWRQSWGLGDFPFYYVQIAPFRWEPLGTGKILREAQLKSLAVPNTGMVVTLDIGDLDNIHPKNKQDVGRRLALWALAKTYSRTGIVYSGPLFKSMKPEGSKIRIYFDHVGAGLWAKHGALSQFLIAEKDLKFVEAKAVIEGDTLVVSSEIVPHPIAVRYAWSNEPQASLFNKDGLPASPFRTDH